MHKRTILYTTLTVSLLFIGANTFLIEKADSKVDREVRVSEWEPVNKGDLAKELPKAGVVASKRRATSI